MADKIRRVDYFYVHVPDKPGEGHRILAAVKEAGVNLLSLTAFPDGIAIRYVRPAQGQSAVRKLGELGSAAYAHRSLLQADRDWRGELPWVGFAQVADRWPEFRWIEQNVPPEHVALTVNGGPAYTELVARGYGAGLLTCIEGAARPDLERVSGASPLIVREIWLLVLPELRRNATVRKVLDWLIRVTKGDLSTLLGSTAKGELSGALEP